MLLQGNLVQNHDDEDDDHDQTVPNVSKSFKKKFQIFFVTDSPYSYLCACLSGNQEA